MNKESELDCYLFYMWNRWDSDECTSIFGMNLGGHIFHKWLSECESCGRIGAAASFYAELDKDKRRMIVERAMAHYNK